MKNEYKIPLNFGAISGLVALSIFLLNYLLEINPYAQISIPSFWIFLLFIYLSINKLRNIEGFISFKKAFIIGIIYTFSYYFFRFFTEFLFISFVDDSILKNFLEQQIEQLILSSEQVDNLPSFFKSFFNEELIDKSIEDLKNTTPFKYYLSQYLSSIFGGAILSLIFAAFMKKNRNIFETPTDEQN